MIKVTRLNGKEFVVNADLIQYLEETPDTIITLVNHEKVVVKEKVDEVIRRVIEYNRGVRMGVPLQEPERRRFLLIAGHVGFGPACLRRQCQRFGVAGRFGGVHRVSPGAKSRASPREGQRKWTIW